MKNYELMIISKGKYFALVLSNSYESPISMREEISEELAGRKGYVLFDLLLINGQSKNRFIEAYFNGYLFKFNTFKPIENISKDILNMCFEYYYKNPELFKNSVLTNVERFCFLKANPT